MMTRSLHLPVQAMRDGLEVIFHRRVDIQRIAAGRAGDDLFHVTIRRVQQAAGFRRRQHAIELAVPGAHRLVPSSGSTAISTCGYSMPGWCGRAHLFADVQHGRFIALAFADDDVRRRYSLPRKRGAWPVRRPDRRLLRSPWPMVRAAEMAASSTTWTKSPARSRSMVLMVATWVDALTVEMVTVSGRQRYFWIESQEGAGTMAWIIVYLSAGG